MRLRPVVVVELPCASKFAKEETVIATFFVLIELFFRHADAATNVPAILRRIILKDRLGKVCMRKGVAAA